MKVVADRELCAASETCAVCCPEVFGNDEDGVVVLLQGNPAEELRAAVQEAVDSCPAAALELNDD